jgi:amino acid transporter
MFTSPSFMLIFLVIGQGLFPGANLPVSALLALIPSLIIAYVYAQFSAALPRSGGDYIFVGRVLHPSLGFMANFVITVINISVIGVEAVWISTFALGPMLNALSVINHDPSLAAIAANFNNTTVQFLLGAAFATLLTLVLFLGTNVTFKLKSVLFVVAVISILAFIVGIGTIPSSQAASNFASLSGTSYNSVISAAKGAGANLSFNSNDTLLGVVYTYLAVSGFWGSAYVAGEVKNPARSQLIGMVAAPVVYILLMTGVAVAAYTSIGHDFLASIAYLNVNSNPAYTLPAGVPTLNFLAGYFANNAALEIFLGIGLLCTLFAYMIAASYASVRSFFAWSFDAVIPRKFSEVNEKYHVPQ